MSQTATFSPGQRWIVSTEPELGLGLITQFDGRIARISFPAAEEERAYSVHNAPLSRVRFAVGEQIEDDAGVLLQVREVEEQGGFLRYLCRDAEGEERALPETRLSATINIHGPRERVLTGQFDRLSHYALRIATTEQAWRLEASPVRGLLGGRIELLPHQCYLAAEISARLKPRVLLADEVGLGKTIEAGLILRQLLHSGRVRRALIIVPDALLHQWLVEMLRRFHLQFTILDEARCVDLESEGDDEEALNPFETAQLVLCPASLILSDEDRLAQALDAGWDALIVDEAHHLQWSPEGASDAYIAVAALAESTPAVLLLTATPEQLGPEGHFARLRLLDPERFPSLTAFAEEQSRYVEWGQLLDDIEAAQQITAGSELYQRLSTVLGEKELQALLAADDPADAAQRLEAALLDRHGTGRALFRNTRHSVGGFPPRSLHAWPLEAPEAYQEAEHLAELSLLEKLRPEQLLGPEWAELDPRVHWLKTFLEQHRREKILLICSSAETVQDLDQILRVRGGVYAAVFHEGMSLLERDRAAAWFAEPEQGAQILLCSEIGSEGRNFQFAQHLVLFDLPFDCDLLEQRIGRLDRIGHQGEVCIHTPYYQGTAMERLLCWYRDGLNAFAGPVPAAAAVQAAFGEELDDAVAHVDGHIDDLLARARDFVAEARREQQRGRDRLLERNSCRPQRAAELIGAIEEAERAEPLEQYLEQALEEFGVDSEALGEKTWLLRPGPRMQAGVLPGLEQEGLSVTFDRATAVQRDDLQFISWEHPLVEALMDQVTHSQYGNAALCSVPLRGLAPGTVLLAAEFNVHCPAPKALGVGRYLGQPPLRRLIDAKGRDFSQQISVQQLLAHAQRVPRQHAPALVRKARPMLEQGLGFLNNYAEAERAALVDAGLASVRRERGAEQSRLEALLRVNPLLDQSDVDAYARETEALERHIAVADWRLDSILLAIVSG